MGLTIEDDGIVPVTIGAVTQHLDVYAVWTHLAELGHECGRKHPDDRFKANAEYLRGVQAFLQGAGFGDVSMLAADRFDAAVAGAIDALKKVEPPAPTPA